MVRVPRLQWILAFVITAVALSGCGGAPKPPTGRTPQEGVEVFLRKPVAVLQEVKVEKDRILIFRIPGEEAPRAVMVSQTKWGRWEKEGGWYSGPLRDIGPVSFAQNALGEMTEEVGRGTSKFARVHATYGVVNDPRITWVEVTLTHEENMTMRAPVVNGTWVAWFYRRSGTLVPQFSIRGGDDDTELFSIAEGWKR